SRSTAAARPWTISRQARIDELDRRLAFSGRQLRHSGALTNGRKSLHLQVTRQTASGRHTCPLSGGLRKFAHFPGVKNLTRIEKDRTLRAALRLTLLRCGCSFSRKVPYDLSVL